MKTRSKSKNQQIIVWGGLAASWGLLAAATVRGDKADLVSYVPNESNEGVATAVSSEKQVDFSFEGSYKQVTQPEILSTPQWGYVAPAATVGQVQPIAAANQPVSQASAEAVAISAPSIYEASVYEVSAAPAPVYAAPVYAAPVAQAPIYQAPVHTEILPPPALAEVPQPRFSGQFTAHKTDRVKPANPVSIDIEPAATRDFEEINISPGAAIPATENLSPQGLSSPPANDVMSQGELTEGLAAISSVDTLLEDFAVDELPKFESNLSELEPVAVPTELTVTSVAIADVCAGNNQTVADTLSEPSTVQAVAESDAAQSGPISYEGDVNTPRFSQLNADIAAGKLCPV